MIKKILAAIAMIILTAGHFRALAQEETPAPLDSITKKEIIDSISERYYDWSEISVSGKLTSPMLPMSASVKIYMKKGELVVITLSAPLVGEAARIEIDQEEILMVNKMKNAYTTIATSEIEPILPGGLEAVQNLLLARINILGSGELATTDIETVEIYPVDDDTFMLLPTQDMENAPFIYFYTIDKASLDLERFAVLSQTGAEADCYYTRNKKKLSIEMVAMMGGAPLDATLELNSPDSNPKEIKRFTPSSSFKKTDLKGIMK